MKLFPIERAPGRLACFFSITVLFLTCYIPLAQAVPPDRLGPEEVLRKLVRANAEKDLATMAAYMAQDSDIISYTIGGRKYVGWKQFSKEMEEEFQSVTRLEIPITELKVWTRGDVAWFAMELDYIRYIGAPGQESRTLLPLRETGVLERRNGGWILLSWHESLRTIGDAVMSPGAGTANGAAAPAEPASVQPTLDLSGNWEIHEEDKSYTATLDRQGNGTYSWQGGRITTTAIADNRIQGSWAQTGNDREGGFEVLLSTDGQEARGVWWYTRVGDKTNIPPRQWGGTYVWKRLVPAPPKTGAP